MSKHAGTNRHKHIDGQVDSYIRPIQECCKSHEFPSSPSLAFCITNTSCLLCGALLFSGVKYLHHEAKKFDIGIYFESNGHGTVLFKPTLMQRLQDLDENVRSRHCFERPWCCLSTVSLHMPALCIIHTVAQLINHVAMPVASTYACFSQALLHTEPLSILTSVAPSAQPTTLRTGPASHQ